MGKRFSPHLELAKKSWKSHLKKGDLAIDATCGNGYDTLFLSSFCDVIALDIQSQALENTRALLQEHGKKAKLLQLPHEKIDTLNVKPALIVYNLGYLPKGDKAITTKVASTLESVQKAMEMMTKEGAVSITCYPGHEEGKKEESALLEFFTALPSSAWTVCHHRWLNRINAPTFLWVQRALQSPFPGPISPLKK